MSPETAGDNIELDNDTYLLGVDFAGTSSLNMFKINTSDFIEAGTSIQITGKIFTAEERARETLRQKRLIFYENKN